MKACADGKEVKKNGNDLSISPLVAKVAAINQSQQSSKYEWALTYFAIQKVHIFSAFQGCQTYTGTTRHVRARKHVIIFGARMGNNTFSIGVSYVALH
jgi:hypothetical protein